MKIVVDTSVIIDYTRSKKGDFLNVVKSGAQIYIPMIVLSELWAGKGMDNTKEEKLVERIISGMEKIDLDEKFAKISGKLLRSGKVVGAPDAIIAACTLKLDANLATSNKKHFSKVPNLKIFNSKKI